MIFCHGLIPSTNKLFLLQEINTLFDFLKSETQRNKSLTLKGFLHTLDLLDSHDIGLRMQKVIHSGEGVQFMTLHGSKGLEFDTVFMIGNDHKTWTSSVTSRFKLLHLDPMCYIPLSKQKMLGVCFMWESPDLNAGSLYRIHF